MEIESLDNKQVKRVASLYKKKYRDNYKEFIIEGIKLVEEAINYNQDIKNIYYCPDMINYNFPIKAIEVSKDVICKMSDTSTPQGIIAVCGIPQNKIYKKEKLIYLDRVQDPGNVGTIIRTADAFGFDGVLLSDECADVYSPKVVRSTMGSLFHIPILTNVSTYELKELNVKIYSSSLDTHNFIDNIKIKKPFVLVVGNEGRGISKEIKDITDEFVKIDMKGNAESLNASIAAGILMYELALKNRG